MDKPLYWITVFFNALGFCSLCFNRYNRRPVFRRMVLPILLIWCIYGFFEWWCLLGHNPRRLDFK
jgi:hypothetical protein